jgi:hypothetical protein
MIPVALQVSLFLFQHLMYCTGREIVGRGKAQMLSRRERQDLLVLPRRIATHRLNDKTCDQERERHLVTSFCFERHASPDPVSSDGRLSRKSTGSPMARVHKFPAVTRMERTCPQPPRQDAVRLSVLRPPFSPALFSGVPLDKGGWNKPVESALVAPGGTTWVERIWTNN